MALGQFALQSAIYSRLSSDNTLTSTLGAAVVDEALQGQSYPFVALGEETTVDFSTKDVDGRDVTINIHVWSQYKGSKQTKDIIDRLHTLLHDYSLSVSGHNLINLRFEFSDIMRDPDGITRHGVMRFNAKMLGTS